MYKNVLNVIRKKTENDKEPIHYAQCGDNFDQRLDYLTTRLLARDFSQNERAVAKRTYDGFIGFYSSNAAEAKKLLAVGESPPDEALPVTESAAWTLLASEMMNLDELLNK